MDKEKYIDELLRIRADIDNVITELRGGGGGFVKTAPVPVEGLTEVSGTQDLSEDLRTITSKTDGLEQL